MLRILHWNIHSWRDPAGAPNSAAVAALISDTRPHAVSLAEVNEPLGAPEVLAGLAEECGYSWIFVPSVELAEGRGYGNALLTRTPVLAVQQRHVYLPAAGYDGTEPTETRSVLLARLGWAGSSVWVGSTHFPATDQHSRQAAARTLIDQAARLRPPWIVCGDFNAPYQDLFGDRDHVLGHPESADPTYPADGPVVPIDYVLTSPEVVMKAEVIDAAGSDHLPLLALARLV